MTISDHRRNQSKIDQWFYTSLAALFFATAVIGFGPNSIAILTESRESPPLLVHVHAFIMTLWLLLLLTQAGMIATKRGLLHRRLGIASFLLVPIMVILMAVLAITTFEPGPHANAIAVVQVRRVVLFSGFFYWAIQSRRTDPETHKRMQYWATVVLLDAAILRMPWLPSFGIDNIGVAQTYQLLLMLPAVAYDLYRTGSVHKTHWVGFGLMIASTVVASVLW